MLKNRLFYNKTKQYIFTSLLFIIFLYISSLSINIYAANSYMKCWINSDDVTECGNRVPREYYNTRVRFIDGRGVTRDIKERSKTKEERIAAQEAEQKEKERLALEKNQEREKITQDGILLKTYLTVDDILDSMNTKLDLTTSRINIFKGSLPTKKKKFDQLVKEAANMERAGKKVSKNLIAKLDALRADLKNTKLQIKIEEDKLIDIKRVYRKDVERFVLVKTNQMKNKAITKQQQEKLHISQIFCENKQQCTDYWKQATEFVKEFSNTAITYRTDIFSVSDTPKKPEDIAMTLALLGDTLKENTKIILIQIRCHRSSREYKACSSDRIKNILNDFRGIIAAP